MQPVTLEAVSAPDLVASPVQHESATLTPLVLEHLAKRWRGNPHPVLEGVQLTVEPGTATWVGGRNGVGKTTLLRIAAGLIDPDRGRVRACGVSPHADRVRYQRLVAFLPAGDRGLYARLTVRQHLEFWARISMVSRDRVRRCSADAIEAFDLAELADRRVDRMSMGQRQRLRIAMTFLPGPAVVLLDEPLNSLDEDGVDLLEGAVREVLDRGGAVLWCSPSGERTDMTFDARFTLVGGTLETA
jgi:ABC-2 type transport system ATP-binding protein